MLDRLDLDTDKPSEEEVARKFGFEDDYFSGNLSWWQKTKPKLWSLFDEPYSSQAAKVCITVIGIDFTVSHHPLTSSFLDSISFSISRSSFVC